jgi:hypothetical protein
VEETFLDRFLSVGTNVSPDPFATPETNARATRYNVGGIPNVIFDGLDQHVGTEPCPDMIGPFTEAIDRRLDATGESSPVRITGEMTINGNLAHLAAHFELVDPGYSFTAHQATLYVYEDSIRWTGGPGGIDIWNEMVRMVRSTPLSLTTVGEVKTVNQTLNMSGFVVPINRAHVRPAALFEETGGSKTVIQASDFVPLDYAMDFAVPVASVPGGGAYAYFQGRIVNFAGTGDVLHLSIGSGFGWPADFRTEGDPSYYQERDVALGPGEPKAVTVRVLTDGVRRAASGELTAQSQTTGRVSGAALRLFNASPALLLVDADGGGDQELPFIDALEGNGYLFDRVTGVDQRGLRGYDCVIWETGYRHPTLQQVDLDNLSLYLDGGGALFVSSMGYLPGSWYPDNFAAAYLGVTGWVDGTGAGRAVGVGGDPITDGMDMALDWPAPDSNRVDTLEPAEGAEVIFRSETGNPAAVRFQGPTFGTVLNTVCQDAFPAAGPDPNNTRAVIARTVAWLLDYKSSGVSAAPARAPRLTLQAGPNPARGSAELRFTLGPDNVRFVRLSFLNAGGRVVRTLETASLRPGFQRMTWDAADEAGRPVPSGLYFARLYAERGTATAKIIVLH